MVVQQNHFSLQPQSAPLFSIDKKCRLDQRRTFVNPCQNKSAILASHSTEYLIDKLANEPYNLSAAEIKIVEQASILFMDCLPSSC